MKSALNLYVNPRRPRNRRLARIPLDLSAASLTPDQRVRMLALVEQDRAIRRRRLTWLTVGAVAFVAWELLLTIIVLGLVTP